MKLGLPVYGLILLSSLAACGGAQREPENLAFQYVTHTTYSGISENRFIVARDNAAWESIWQAHSADRTPTPATPSIDFTREMVVGVVLAGRPSGCYSVDIVSVKRHFDPERIVVTYRENTPAADAICTAAITQPTAFARTATSAANVEFQAAN